MQWPPRAFHILLCNRGHFRLRLLHSETVFILIFSNDIVHFDMLTLYKVTTGFKLSIMIYFMSKETVFNIEHEGCTCYFTAAGSWQQIKHLLLCSWYQCNKTTGWIKPLRTVSMLYDNVGFLTSHILLHKRTSSHDQYVNGQIKCPSWRQNNPPQTNA